ncbi:Coatomer subunit gamma-1 [Histomonas meleagridis]|uniref:Coatomer subunit gamma-1 n=1 Tax=Histomonas meleagridis TaxID=135588 RepID=UPI00355A19F6|nr:Coatomer subunit gamma-1 [Histomonas meleagridis]KAH0796908.1 Coatomer subunit gamma-1 [Histomonas meleagridis]
MESTSHVQGSVIFQESPIDVAKCQKYLIRILHAIYSNEKFSDIDKETIFFAITQAYSNKDLLLHRLLILVLKYLDVPKGIAIMATHSLSQDISSDVQMNKARAVRLLPSLLPFDQLISQERFIKQILLSREPFPLASCLSCVLSLCLNGHSDTVNKWIPEIHQAASLNSYAQSLALLIIYYLRRGDGNLLRKMATQLQDKTNYSSLSSHVMIQVWSEANQLSPTESANKYFRAKLQSSSPITQLDAARAILSNDNSSSEDVQAAVSKLNSLLSSPSNSAVFASLRTISQYSAKHREEFSKCNTILERLLSQSESNISALAAIALLHTGFESTIDRVLPLISQFASKLASDQQKSLLNSCVEVARRHVSKIQFILNFMWNTFRSTDNLEVQRVFVKSLFNLSQEVQSSQPIVFGYLCEYVEDSKFIELTSLIIHFLGEKGVTQENKSEIVRCLCNRLSLECAEVRAASIDALASFIKCDNIRDAVLRIIKRHLNDPDDEVRDRAVFHCQVIENSYNDLIDIPKVNILPIEKSEERTNNISNEIKMKIVDTPITKYGKPLNEGMVINVTDQDADLVVNYNTKIYNDVIIFEFNVTNTLTFSIINVKVILDNADEFEEVENIQCDNINTNETGTVYYVIKRNKLNSFEIGIFPTTIVFQYVQDDMNVDEEFVIDDSVRLTIGDYIDNYNIKVGDYANENNEFKYQNIEKIIIKTIKNMNDALKHFKVCVGLPIDNEIMNENKSKILTLNATAELFNQKIVIVLKIGVRNNRVLTEIRAYANDEKLPKSITDAIISQLERN